MTMHTPFRLILTFAAVVSMALPSAAQIDPPPDFIDYQGRVLDALGNPVAQGTTENIEMYFRIWNHISDTQIANLVWAEKQVVTVADGNFSVRLGEGDPIESSAGDNVIVPGNDDPRPPLLGVFAVQDGTMRYLGVSVAANSTVKPSSEIQPRLAFLTSPFAAVAEKARFAEFGPSNGTFVADVIGVGTSAPGSLIEAAGSQELGASSGGGLISAGSFTGPHVALDADDIQGYSDGATPSVLNVNVHGGDINVGSTGTLTTVNGNLVVPNGSVGIGSNPPAGALDVFGLSHGGRFIVEDVAPSGDEQLIVRLDAAFGVNGAQLRFEGDAGNIDIGQNLGGDFVVESNNTPRFVVEEGGRVGIGTESPTDSLTVAGSGNIRLDGGSVEFDAGASDGLQWWYDGAFFPYVRVYHDSNNRFWAVNGANGMYIAPNGTSWTPNSDERLKSDLEPLTGILDKIEDIRVVAYNMASLRPDLESGKLLVDRDRPPRKLKSGKVIKHEIGTVAQDWMADFPELVVEPQSEDDFYALAYDRIGIVAIGAAQELSAKLKAQEAQLKARDEKIADLEARLARLEAMMKAAK